MAGGPVIEGGTTPYAWYRADMGLTPYDGDASKLAWWQDQSGNSRHIESFGEPSITNNGNDGAQVITFDGDEDQLVGDADLSEWGEAEPGTLFAVWKRSADATGDNYVYDAQLDEQRQLLHVMIESESMQAGGAVYDGGWINHLSQRRCRSGFRPMVRHFLFSCYRRYGHDTPQWRRNLQRRHALRWNDRTEDR